MEQGRMVSWGGILARQADEPNIEAHSNGPTLALLCMLTATVSWVVRKGHWEGLLVVSPFFSSPLHLHWRQRQGERPMVNTRADLVGASASQALAVLSVDGELGKATGWMSTCADVNGDFRTACCSRKIVKLVAKDYRGVFRVVRIGLLIL